MEESSTGDRQFFDDVYRRGARKSVSKYSSVVQCSRRHYEELIFAHCPRKTVLEYGCGTGSYAFSLAKRGAKVTGVDISEVAIALAKERAAEMGVEDVSFHVMDAEQMQLEDNSFDAACGTGILHHLRLHQALKELARTLKPGGSATFIEPMGHNPAINLFRRLTPSLRAKDEHPHLPDQVRVRLLPGQFWIFPLVLPLSGPIQRRSGIFLAP